MSGGCALATHQIWMSKGPPQAVINFLLNAWTVAPVVITSSIIAILLILWSTSFGAILKTPFICVIRCWRLCPCWGEWYTSRWHNRVLIFKFNDWLIPIAITCAWLNPLCLNLRLCSGTGMTSWGIVIWPCVIFVNRVWLRHDVNKRPAARLCWCLNWLTKPLIGTR